MKKRITAAASRDAGPQSVKAESNGSPAVTPLIKVDIDSLQLTARGTASGVIRKSGLTVTLRLAAGEAERIANELLDSGRAVRTEVSRSQLVSISSSVKKG